MQIELQLAVAAWTVWIHFAQEEEETWEDTVFSVFQPPTSLCFGSDCSKSIQKASVYVDPRWVKSGNTVSSKCDFMWFIDFMLRILGTPWISRIYHISWISAYFRVCLFSFGHLQAVCWSHKSRPQRFTFEKSDQISSWFPEAFFFGRCRRQNCQLISESCKGNVWPAGIWNSCLRQLVPLPAADGRTESGTG